jgi:hypothetical protein
MKATITPLLQMLPLFAATVYGQIADCSDPDNNYLCECQNLTNPLFSFKPGFGSSCIVEEARRKKLRVGGKQINSAFPMWWVPDIFWQYIWTVNLSSKTNPQERQHCRSESVGFDIAIPLSLIF